MDYEKIKEAAQNYQDDMTRFLRAIVKNPGESCDERKHIETIEAEIDALEQNLARNEADMAANSSDFVRLNDLMAEKTQLEEQLLSKMERWEYLSQIAEQMEK